MAPQVVGRFFEFATESTEEKERTLINLCVLCGQKSGEIAVENGRHLPHIIHKLGQNAEWE
ncbi:MAG: hypothetical protein DHS20C20_08090 [Ardenticatenaceae bacterium]|nr:MAG: hypothetical protein DHS20C20_08090 [Ardenticatenaceae bacterium]